MNFILHTELCRWLKEQKIGGDREAIFLYKLLEWVEKNEANERNYHDGCYWSYNSLRGMTRIFPWSKRELETTINKLRDAGIIRAEKLSKDPQNMTLFYTVCRENLVNSPIGERVSPNGDTPSLNGDSTLSPNGDNLSPNGEIYNEHIKTHKRNIYIPSLFDRFWAAYPRKVSKADARKVFAKLSPDEQMVEMMLQALDWQKRLPEWTKDGGRYVPYPATWLNSRRWEDEQATPLQVEPAKRKVEYEEW